MSRLGKPGRIPSEETREKMRQAHLGKKASDETKAKLAAASTTSRPVISLDMETLEVAQYPSQSAAARVNGSGMTNLCLCCAAGGAVTGGRFFCHAEDFVDIDTCLARASEAATLKRDKLRAFVATLKPLRDETKGLRDAETRRKMSESHPKRAVIATDMLGVEERFESTRAAAAKGYASSNIVACCKGRKLFAYARAWRYA